MRMRPGEATPRQTHASLACRSLLPAFSRRSLSTFFLLFFFFVFFLSFYFIAVLGGEPLTPSHWPTAQSPPPSFLRLSFVLSFSPISPEGRIHSVWLPSDGLPLSSCLWSLLNLLALFGSTGSLACCFAPPSPIFSLLLPSPPISSHPPPRSPSYFPSFHFSPNLSHSYPVAFPFPLHVSLALASTRSSTPSPLPRIRISSQLFLRQPLLVASPNLVLPSILFCSPL